MLRPLMCYGVRFTGFVACFVVAATAFAGSKTTGGKVIRQLTLDENAPVVELFDGVDAGQFEVKLTAKSANEATVLIKNLTDEALTVKVPKAAVGVHILPQMFGQGNNFNPFGNNNNQNNGLNQNDPNRGQTVGGFMQPGGGNQMGFPNQNNNGNGIGNAPGIGFFSIPPEKTVQLKMKTVCLDYGQPDPHVGMKYELRRLESAISNPALRELLENYSPRDNQDVMQAAAWHLANGLSWNQISNLQDDDVSALAGGTKFSANTVKAAQALVKQAEEAAKNADKKPAEKTEPAKVVRTSLKK